LVFALQKIGFPHFPDFLAIAVVDEAEAQIQRFGEKLVEVLLRQLALDELGWFSIHLDDQILQLKLVYQVVLDAHNKGHRIVGSVLEDFHLKINKGGKLKNK
jgi:hypothetical protein